MANLVILRSARVDLMNLADYGTERWGAAAAYQFLDGLEKELSLLERHPAIGRSRLELASGARSWLYRGYLIFYRQVDNEVIIGRIIHAAADLPSRLNFDAVGE